MSGQRLIDANALLIGLRGNVLIDVTPEIEYEIEKTPTIDPVRHGKWEVKQQTKMFNENNMNMKITGKYPTCSLCGFAEMGISQKTNYCPHCGAKMGKE